MQVSFTLNEELTVYGGGENKTVSAPREHPFTMQSVGGQTLAVFTETSSGECALRASAPERGTGLSMSVPESCLCQDSPVLPCVQFVFVVHVILALLAFHNTACNPTIM